MTIKNLNDLLDEAVNSASRRTAYVTQDESLTYAEFYRRVLATAAGFAALGVKRGDCIAIVHRNSPIFIQAYLAAMRLGAIAVPINFMVQKPDELAYMLNDCKAVGIVTQKEFLKGLRSTLAKTPSIKNLWVSDAQPAELQSKEQPFSALSSNALPMPPRVELDENDTASILYTSGTTGNPKGVMLTHRNFLTNCEGVLKRVELTSNDVGLCLMPMFHSFAWTGNVMLGLKLKMKLVIAPSIAPAKPWLKLMGRHGVTLFAAVPQVYAALAREARDWKTRVFLKL